MKHLPTTNGMNLGFFGCDLKTTLFSLGHIHTSGGCYTSAVATKHHGPASFLYFRAKLMGTKPPPLFTQLQLTM